MKRTTKCWLWTGTGLILAGIVLFVIALWQCQGDLSKLSTVTYETTTHQIAQDFDALSIQTNTADIRFAVSEDGKCMVVCQEDTSQKHTVTVEENTLVIRVTNHKQLYDYIGIRLGTPKVTVYLPKAAYTTLLIRENTGDIHIPGDFRFTDMDLSLSTGDVYLAASVSGSGKIRTSTGHIRAENLSAENLQLTVSTGSITATNITCQGDLTLRASTGDMMLSNVTCRNLTSSANTGDITLQHVIAAEALRLHRSTGDVRFDGADAAEIFVETGTGNVTGSLLSPKIFMVETDTGDVSVPGSTSGGICEVITDTGDIRLQYDD